MRTGLWRCIKLMMKEMRWAKMTQSLFLIPWITKLFAFRLIVRYAAANDYTCLHQDTNNNCLG